MPGKKASEALRREQIIQAAFRVAKQKGLEQLTIRLVAAEAGLSNGLVFFHFQSKETLLLALLDWLLASIFELWEASEDLPPAERVFTLIRLDLQDLSQDEHDGARLNLFFAYWALAVHDPIIKERIQQALERSRQAFLPAVQAWIESDPVRFHDVTAEALVTTCIGIVQGCAMQALLNEQRVDVEQLVRVIRALLLPSFSSANSQ
ncbi:TetR family transcriptional regulator [Ktedonosporobacter rubrisoli]|uniref:TetR family transcriptional regulator n=1 Tax=Ktedonosporobacter rubrisoli TaxID=2509675 RepID=A0A4P6JJH4_KTERU|nr:TetR family transcriptional regulator [Ktedonosporobacter rubrisoli]QBD75258.1 TetR family transcriptional regulator [Ktedonosporobacter rubrisoli]